MIVQYRGLGLVHIIMLKGHIYVKLTLLSFMSCYNVITYKKKYLEY